MDDYWNYYDAEFDWNDAHELVRSNQELTRRRFTDLGFSSSEVDSLVSSGYVMVPAADIVIDRYYGGALLSYDFTTRIPATNFKEWLSSGCRPVPVRRATSMRDVLAQIERWRAEARRPLVFRGQTTNYSLTRDRPNPSLSFDGLGEISLLPSLWRVMRAKAPMSFHAFTSLSLFEWSKIIFSQFDMTEVQRRRAALNAAGAWIHTDQDMEDSDDPVLQEFGRVSLDLRYGATTNMADLLATLLQHYGLYSPVLDLTTDFDVAAFFATHRLIREAGVDQYRFVGSNARNAVIYVFALNDREMTGYTQERVLNRLKPLRPERQSCVICRTSPFALNLAADFLVGLIMLDFDDVPGGKYTSADLFPEDGDDNFLAALKKRVQHPERLLDVRTVA